MQFDRITLCRQDIGILPKFSSDELLRAQNEINPATGRLLLQVAPRRVMLLPSSRSCPTAPMPRRRPRSPTAGAIRSNAMFTPWCRPHPVLGPQVPCSRRPSSPGPASRTLSGGKASQGRSFLGRRVRDEAVTHRYRKGSEFRALANNLEFCSHSAPLVGCSFRVAVGGSISGCDAFTASWLSRSSFPPSRQSL
jgi:hypothetical protein